MRISALSEARDVFRFPEYDPLARKFFFYVHGFSVKYSTMDLFRGLFRAGCKPLSIHYREPAAGSKTKSTTVRVHLATSTAPPALSVDGLIMNQICLDNVFFLVRVKNAPVDRAPSGFKKDGGRCVYLWSGTTDTNSVPPMHFRTSDDDDGTSSSNSDGPDKDNEGSDRCDESLAGDSTESLTGDSTPEATDDETSAAVPNDTLTSSSDTASDATNPCPPDVAAPSTTPSLDLSLSVILDVDDLNVTWPNLSNGTLDDSFDSTDFVTVSHGSSKKRRTTTPSTPTRPRTRFGPRNQYELLEAYELDFEVETWTPELGDTPTRVALTPTVKFPMKSLKGTLCSFPCTHQQDDRKRVIYTDTISVADIDTDIRSVLDTVSSISSNEMSEASVRNAKHAKQAWLSFGDPFTLVADIKREPLAHALAFGLQHDHDPLVIDSVVRLHTIQRVVAATDEDVIRPYGQRVQHLLRREPPLDREEVCQAFRVLAATTSDPRVEEALFRQDALSLFELALMMYAPSFFYNDLLLAAYLHAPVMWLPAEPTRLIHSLSLLSLLTTDLGREIVSQLRALRPSHRWCQFLASGAFDGLVEEPNLLVTEHEGRVALVCKPARRC